MLSANMSRSKLGDSRFRAYLATQDLARWRAFIKTGSATSNDYDNYQVVRCQIWNTLQDLKSNFTDLCELHAQLCSSSETTREWINTVAYELYGKAGAKAAITEFERCLKITDAITASSLASYRLQRQVDDQINRLESIQQPDTPSSLETPTPDHQPPQLTPVEVKPPTVPQQKAPTRAAPRLTRPREGFLWKGKTRRRTRPWQPMLSSRMAKPVSCTFRFYRLHRLRLIRPPRRGAAIRCLIRRHNSARPHQLRVSSWKGPPWLIERQPGYSIPEALSRSDSNLTHTAETRQPFTPSCNRHGSHHHQLRPPDPSPVARLSPSGVSHPLRMRIPPWLLRAIFTPPADLIAGSFAFATSGRGTPLEYLNAVVTHLSLYCLLPLMCL